MPHFFWSNITSAPQNQTVPELFFNSQAAQTFPPLSFSLSFEHIVMNTLMFKMCNNISTLTWGTLEHSNPHHSLKWVLQPWCNTHNMMRSYCKIQFQYGMGARIAISSTICCPSNLRTQLSFRPSCKFSLEKIISTYAKDFCNKKKAIIHQI